MATLRCLLIAATLVFAVVGCSKPEDARHDPGKALAIAKDYADKHFPKGIFQPNGARLEYLIEDAGDI